MIQETTKQILTFPFKKHELKGGMDKVCGENNQNIIFINGLLSGSDVSLTRKDDDIEIVDEYGSGLGKLTLDSLRGMKSYCLENRSKRLKEVPQEIIRLAFSDITTILLTKRNDKLIASKEENIQIRTPNAISISPRNESQKNYIRALKTSFNRYTIGLGEAGTGKTYLAVAAATEALETGGVEKIILTRPVVATEDMGFLPGDANEKMHPYMQPLYDALNETVPHEKLKEFMDNGIIQIAPLAFMRGRTLKNAFVVLDEAQNTRTKQMEMFLTRMGENCHVAICGDITQNDLRGETSGLEDLVYRLEQEKSDVFQMFKFNKEDVVRSHMTKQAVDLYAKTEAISEAKKLHLKTPELKKA